MALIAIISLELYCHWHRMNWKFVDPNAYYKRGESIEFITKDTSIYRAFGLDNEDRYHFDYENSKKMNGLLIPDLATFHRVQDPQGMNNFTLWNYWKVLEVINKKRYPLENIYSRDPFHLLAIMNPEHRLIDLFNAKYLLTYYPLKETERWKLILDKEVKVYQNKKVIPRVFIAYRYKVIQDKRLYEILDSPDFNPEECVILDTDITQSIGPASVNTAQITKYTPLEIEINAHTEKPGILVLGDSFYPGWRAKVDGRPVKIFRAYSIFRALPISEGNHKIIFKYLPLSFISGCIISVITFLIIILEGIRRLFRF